MPKQESLEVGVIVERLRIDHPWQEWDWRPVGVFVGAATRGEWAVVAEEDGRTHYHAATLPIELHRRDTEAYVYNLTTEQPSVYVVMREATGAGSEDPFEVVLVTASPYEAQDYMDTGEEIVGRVAMPEPVLAWVQHFIEHHHVEEKFIKRRRDKVRLEEHKFGQEPIADLRKRMPDPPETSNG